MTRTRRTLRWTAAAAAIALTATGCNLVGGGGDDSESEGSGENVTVTVALVPDPPGASEFYRAQFDEFEDANPDITVEVVENPSDQQLSAVELMFQQGDPPDVFRAQDNGMDRMNDRGWVAPLDDYVTDEFIDRFPEGSMDPATSGLHRDGKLISLPLVWGKWSSLRVLVYNKAVLKDNGFDNPPETWSELESMATTITANGGGDVFGYAPAAAKAPAVEMLAPQGGPYSVAGRGVDLRTGEADTVDPALVEAVEMHRRMQAAGVMMPGWESWDGARAFTEFASGKLAMYPTAPWHVAEIRKLTPEIAMGVVALPVPDSGRGGYSGLASSFSPMWGMSAETEHPDEAWKVMDFLASESFHRAYYEEFGTLTALEDAWIDQAMENPDQKAIIEAADESMQPVPNPRLASEGGNLIMAALEAKPELKHTDAAVASIINNEPFLPKAEALDEQIEATIEAAIAESGGKASREDITFPDWNPLEPFSPEQ